MIELLLLLAAAPTPAMIAEAPAHETAHDADGGAAASHRASDDTDVSPMLWTVSDTAPAPAAPSAKGTPRQTLGPHLTRSNEHYKSHGRDILIEVLRPDDDRQRPAVLILHGASGIGDGAFYRGAAEIFADRGYVTFLPHYLPALDQRRAKTKEATAPNRAEAMEYESIRAGFSTQDRILRDALDYMSTSRYVDSGRIGIFGLSLGGFHALNLSSYDYRIAAVVDMAGALRGNAMPETNHLAPTLALHGARDATVPVSRARSLAEYLKRLGVPHELVVYPDQGHFFRGKAQQDALARSAAFLGTYLTPSDTSRAARSRDGVE
ncbi:MAG TPA: dienelactone hydrolase family protein [Alphaproteobacteria bacterium]